MSPTGKARPPATAAELSDEFERRYGYRFANADLLLRAVTHTSFAEESPVPIRDNQRLEFLGDSVVGLVVTTALFSVHPDAPEGVMSKIKGSLVSTTSLATAARAHGLGDWLRLGRGEERSHGRAKKRLLADVFEAIAGALMLDGGFEAAQRWVALMFGVRLTDLRSEELGVDYKSELQEILQGEYRARPEYQTLSVAGPGHEQEFTIAVDLDGRRLGIGRGRSKKEAQQDAARAALEALTAAPVGAKETATAGVARHSRNHGT